LSTQLSATEAARRVDSYVRHLCGKSSFEPPSEPSYLEVMKADETESVPERAVGTPNEIPDEQPIGGSDLVAWRLKEDEPALEPSIVRAWVDNALEAASKLDLKLVERANGSP
jgi:hypothetical protein